MGIAGSIEKPAITGLSSTFNKIGSTREAIIGCSDSYTYVMGKVQQAEKEKYGETVKEENGMKFDPTEVEHLVMRNSTYEVDAPQNMPKNMQYREEEEK